jgi:hypothetical protein
MKTPRTGKRTILSAACAALLLLSWIWSPATGLALLALPDIGINYHTMKVNRAEKLIAAGMKKARNGDAISLRTSPEKKIIFTNLRTAEELTYPPEPEAKPSR